ncbi:hypothetical protein D3C72_1891560 [compost metagenome]
MQDLARIGPLLLEFFHAEKLRHHDAIGKQERGNIACRMLVIVHVDGADAHQACRHRRMERALRDRHVDFLATQKAAQLVDAHGETKQLGRQLAAVMLAHHRVLEAMQVEQLDRIGQRPARDHDLVFAFQFADHGRKHIDVRRVGQFKPDTHELPLQQ